MKGVKNKSAQYFLKHHPAPDDIKVLGVEKLIQVLLLVSRGNVSEERALILYNAAQNSICVREGKTSMADEVRDIVERISMYNCQIVRREKWMKHCLAQIPVSRYLLSIKGSGIVTVTCIFSFVIFFHKFLCLPNRINQYLIL